MNLINEWPASLAKIPNRIFKKYQVMVSFQWEHMQCPCWYTKTMPTLKKIKGKHLLSPPEIPIYAPSLKQAMCSKQERMEARLKCQPSKILIGAEALQSGEQNSVSTELSGNELCFVCVGKFGWLKLHSRVRANRKHSHLDYNKCSILLVFFNLWFQVSFGAWILTSGIPVHKKCAIYTEPYWSGLVSWT